MKFNITSRSVRPNRYNIDSANMKNPIAANMLGHIALLFIDMINFISFITLTVDYAYCKRRNPEKRVNISPAKVIPFQPVNVYH